MEPAMNHALVCELEADGRWLAEAPQLLGVMACGATREEAVSLLFLHLAHRAY